MTFLLLLQESVQTAPNPLLGIFPDRAGIDQNEVRLLQAAARDIALLSQNGKDYLAVVHIHLTAVCLYEYSFVICHSIRKDNFLYLCRDKHQ